MPKMPKATTTEGVGTPITESSPVSESDLKSQISDLIDEQSVAAGADVANEMANSAADALSDGADDSSEKTEYTQEFSKNSNSSTDEEKQRKKKEKLDAYSSARNDLADLRKTKITADQAQFRKCVTKHCYVAGYICENDVHVDVATRKVMESQDWQKYNAEVSKAKADAKKAGIEADLSGYIAPKAEYSFYVKQYGPSAILSVIVMCPSELSRIIDSGDYSSEASQKVISELMGTDPGLMKYTPLTIAWSEMASWMLQNTMGTLNESKEIFSEYVTRSKTVLKTAADAYSGNVVKAGFTTPGSYLGLRPVKSPKDVSSCVAVVHSYRSKILAPGNYVAMKRYKDIEIAKRYTPAEASKLNALYFDKFLKEHEDKNTHVKSRKYDSFSAMAKRGVTTTEDGHISESSVFNAGGHAFFFDSDDNKISHWYDRTVDSAGIVSYAKLKKNVISEKETHLTKDNKTSSPKFTKVELKAEGATGAEYVWSAKTFPKIFAATGGGINIAELTSSYATGAKMKRKSGSAAPAVTISSEDLVGLTPEEIYGVLTKGSIMEKVEDKETA